MPTYRVGFKKKDGSWNYMKDPSHPKTAFETTNVREAHARKRRCLEWSAGDGSGCRHQVVVVPSRVPLPNA